jgi:hypothetical protein
MQGMKKDMRKSVIPLTEKKRITLKDHISDMGSMERKKVNNI